MKNTVSENMKDNQTADKIRKVAMDFDNAIENKNIEVIVSAFPDECKIELLGITLMGKDGVRIFNL